MEERIELQASSLPCIEWSNFSPSALGTTIPNFTSRAERSRHASAMRGPVPPKVMFHGDQVLGAWRWAAQLQRADQHFALQAGAGRTRFARGVAGNFSEVGWGGWKTEGEIMKYYEIL